jgi:hypothetical protein
MIVLFNSESASRGMASILQAWSSYFGRWAFPAWIASGLFAFGLNFWVGAVFMPGLFSWPLQGMDWFFAALFLGWALLGGPIAIVADIFIALMFWFFSVLLP